MGTRKVRHTSMGLLDLSKYDSKPSTSTNTKPKEERRVVAPSVFGRPVQDSDEFRRIDALHRRKQSEIKVDSLALAALKKDVVNCKCIERWGFCIKELTDIQQKALAEAVAMKGLLAPIGVGHGKTGICILLPMMFGANPSLLLLPSKLREQFLRDVEQWSVHFQTPNIAGEGTWRPGRPTLHVMSYENLSNAKNTGILKTISPKLVIADEAHSLKAMTSARTKRLKRAMSELKPAPYFCALSGTMTTKSLFDFYHLSDWALGKSSPVPRKWTTVAEWAAAVDAGPVQTSPGVLSKWCSPGETAAVGFGRRLLESDGVVATSASSAPMSLYIKREEHPKVPAEIQSMLNDVEKYWQRPDGEELIEATEKARCVQQLACGFYYRWKWVRGEDKQLQQRWLLARKEWHAELREKLKTAGEGLDSPLLLTNAAKRWLDGYKGDAPVWRSQKLKAWLEVRDLCEPETETVWLSDYLIDFAADFAEKKKCIVWYNFDAMESKLRAKLPTFGAGETEILQETGTRSIAASIRAHGTGRNLQRAFDTSLVLVPPSDGAAWEQLLGRLHRQGQTSDEVWFHVMSNCKQFKKAVDTASLRSQYMTDLIHQEQKLLIASWV